MTREEKVEALREQMIQSSIAANFEEWTPEDEANGALDDRLTEQETEPKPDFENIAQTSTSHAEKLNRLMALVKRGNKEAVDHLAYEVYDEELFSKFDGSDDTVACLLRAAARLADDPCSKIPKKMFAEHYERTGHTLGAVKGEIDAVLDRLNITHDGPVEVFDHD